MKDIENLKNYGLTQTQYDMIKNMICKNATETELQMFFETCKSLNLSPFLKDVYFFVNEYNSKNGHVRNPVIGIGINGYRKIAERTGKYAPGKAVDYTIDKDGLPLSATAYVKKQTQDGTWHEVSATVFASEFSKAKNGGMFFHKLGINAESHALRKAFPDAFGGIYSKEELETSNFHYEDENKNEKKENHEVISFQENGDEFDLEENSKCIDGYQLRYLMHLLEKVPDKKSNIQKYLAVRHNLSTYEKMPIDVYKTLVKKILTTLKKQEAFEDISLESTNY